MEEVIRINQTIGLDVYMNCVLVKNDLRNAMLIQPADYREALSTDPVTAGKLKALKEEFPELIQSDIEGETIISKKPYKNANIKINEDMGKILGFPCAADYTYTLDHPDEPKTSIEILVNLIPGGDDEKIQIVVYVCKDDRTFVQAQDFAAKAEKILKADPIVGKIVSSVIAKKSLSKPPKYLISQLLTNKPITEADQDEIMNYIWNLGLENAPLYNCDFKNPVHKGILVGLLSVYDNNQIEPFYPLQFRKENKQVDKITAQWDAELQTIFKQRGGRRSSTRKSKRRF
jgi:hypothetical protein